MKALGCAVLVEKDAGALSSFPDSAYKEAGAQIIASRSELLKSATIILCVQSPDDKDLKAIPKDSFLIGILQPHSNTKALNLMAAQGIHGFSVDLMPRITRAQSMDVLSSQSNLAGYKSVLDACEYYGRAMPMMMTAAGTIPPAKVFVMGAGVAGLQAIATARRLGGVVSATDVRPAAKEQVESLGGTFIAVEDDEFKAAETSGGYAKEMSKAYQEKQAKLVQDHIAKQDMVITTALIPGRPAPKLITKSMVESMKPGSVIVDMAVETGGNCEMSKPGEVINHKGVSIIGHLNVPSRLASDASALYARNLLNLLTLIIDKDKKALQIDWDDDIIKGIALTRKGNIIHPAYEVKKATKTEKTAAPSPSSEVKKSSSDTKAAAPKKTAAKTTAKKAPAKTKTTAKTTTAKKAPVKKTPVKKAPPKKTAAKPQSKSSASSAAKNTTKKEA